MKVFKVNPLPFCRGGESNFAAIKISIKTMKVHFESSVCMLDPGDRFDVFKSDAEFLFNFPAQSSLG